MRSEFTHHQLLADLTSGSETRAEDAAVRLAEAGASILPLLEPLLTSEVADHRWWAVRTLGQMRDPRTDWLLRAAGDPSSDVRAAALLALVSHPTEEAVPQLVAALDEEDTMVAVLAVDALRAIGKDSIPALLEAYPSRGQRGKIQIMRALAQLPDPRAIPLMMKSIEEGSALLRYWAEQGIERLGLNMVYIKPE